MHCEIVSVNGVGPFLEIEVIVPDNISVPEDCESTQEAQELIKGFFKDVFNITEFDKRTWPQIIEDGN
jgi:adenylate cyclase class IV